MDSSRAGLGDQKQAASWEFTPCLSSLFSIIKCVVLREACSLSDYSMFVACLLWFLLGILPTYSMKPLVYGVCFPFYSSSHPLGMDSQKSQGKNSQKRANSDTRIRRVQKEAKDPKPRPEMSSLSLESIESRLLVYKKNEFVYEEDIKVLKREIHLREVAITNLRRKLDLAQKQKDEIQLTVENFENSSKNLSKLLDCQIVDKCKTVLGYSEPTVKKPIVKTSEAKANSADKPEVVRKNNGAPIIKDWVSNNEEEDVPH
ncbi:hypothetical protein Tco_0236955 [Tanacetum coccineum]